MKITILIKGFLVILTFISCKNHNETKTELNRETLVFKNDVSQIALRQTDSVSEKWHLMVFEKGGCLGGEQYIFVKEFKSEPKQLVFNEVEWKEFAKNDKTRLTEFLLSKLSDTTKTEVHTCPFFVASNGEMAVYALQHIHNKNWFDFTEFKEYKNKKYGSAVDQPQIWLQNILKNEIKRMKLAELYRNELKK